MRAAMVKGLGWRVGVCAVALAAGVGCGEKAGDAGTGTPAGSGAAAATTSARREYSDEANAFVLGRKWGLACVYTLLNKPSEASDSIEAARSIAGVLGVPVPAMPPAANALAELRSPMTPDAITAKKGEKARDVYRLGVAVTNAFYGAVLSGDLTSALSEVAFLAKAAGVPESVWKTQLDAVGPKGSPQQIRQLADDLEAHFKK